MSRMVAISHTLLAKIFIADGWVYKRTKGDHDVYTKDGFIRPVVIPRYEEVGVDIITANMRTAKMSRERYFELLRSCK
ncbi:type II toxin-antitoxin system HicA family toxin [Rudaea sp.]|uniref:type II toxin-antitoxin system HicA family toxin n=1 Tax=Rudaea sp. TaxID=2136325 RepID=UPI0039E2F07D